MTSLKHLNIAKSVFEYWRIMHNPNSCEITFDTLEVRNWFQNPANIYLFNVKNRNTRKGCEICSKLTIKTPKRDQQPRSGVFNVNFEHISHFFVVFLLLNLNK